MSEYNQYRPQQFNLLPVVVKNLLIINGLFFLATITLQAQGIDLYRLFGLHFPTADAFRIWQPFTYLFMHGDFGHIFLNMFALWMFGSALENYWGPKRFLIYYLITGIGAAVIHYIVLYYTSLQGNIDAFNVIIENPAAIMQSSSAEVFAFINGYASEMGSHADFSKAIFALETNVNNVDALNTIRTLAVEAKEYYVDNGTVIVGASGAVFGLLLGYGMLFPNTHIYIYFLFPLKAKYFVMIYGAIELFSGLRNTPGDNVAHFAHLGGMLFGFILIKYWNKKLRNRFY